MGDADGAEAFPGQSGGASCRHRGHTEVVVTWGDISRRELRIHRLCYLLPWTFSNSSTLTVWYFWIYTSAWFLVSLVCFSHCHLISPH